jgi:thiol-disulfide isomerase/thioredoxin
MAAGTRWRRSAAASVAAAVLALAGCAGGSPPAQPAGGPAAGAAATLSFRGRTLDGAQFDAATLAGRPTVLWFWAPWCATCAGQAASVSETAARYGDRLGLLGIAGLGDNAAMREFVRDEDVGAVAHLDDQTGELWRRFRVTEQSTYVLIDRHGRITHTGWLDDQEFTARVQALAG